MADFYIVAFPLPDEDVRLVESTLLEIQVLQRQGVDLPAEVWDWVDFVQPLVESRTS